MTSSHQLPRCFPLLLAAAVTAVALADDRQLLPGPHRLQVDPQGGGPIQGVLLHLENRGRGSSFRSDLGKRDELDEEEEMLSNYPEDVLEEYPGYEAAEKRFRSDLGKRRYRADLGKRRYRADLGKRRYRADLGKRSGDVEDQLEEEEEKRAGFRSDLGKRGGLRWSGRRVFRSDLGKRAYRSDLG